MPTSNVQRNCLRKLHEQIEQTEEKITFLHRELAADALERLRRMIEDDAELFGPFDKVVIHEPEESDLVYDASDPDSGMIPISAYAECGLCEYRWTVSPFNDNTTMTRTTKID